MTISVVVLTFNSEASLGATLESAGWVSDDIHVVDSYSTDSTLAIAERYGATIVQHPFEHYGAQRNWAMENLPLRHGWELHLDSDERLSPELAEAINRLKQDFPAEVVGYYVPRLVHFLGRPIRHGGMYPIWHLRLFRRGAGRCEDRRYDQHFFAQGPTRRIHAPMIDDIRVSLGEWTQRHNRWADSEAAELAAPAGGVVIGGRLAGSPVQQKRALRGAYNRAPLFLRAFGLFFYRYVLRLGFLDGREGLIFFVLQTFWFRFLTDAKLHEMKLAQSADPSGRPRTLTRARPPQDEDAR